MEDSQAKVQLSAVFSIISFHGATTHIQPIEQDCSRALAFSNRRCSVPLESLPPIIASSGYLQWVQIKAPVLTFTLLHLLSTFCHRRLLSAGGTGVPEAGVSHLLETCGKRPF